MRTYILLTLFAILNCSAALGQEVAMEKVYVHLAKNIAVTGETIWYSIFVGQGVGEAYSKVAYTELVGRDNKVVQKSIIMLTNGMADGHMDIPTNLESDHYMLRCYTRTSPLVSAGGVHGQFVTIINPERPPVPRQVATDSTASTFADPATEHDFLPSRSIGKQESITLSLPKSGQSKPYAISVSISNPFLLPVYQGAMDGKIYKPWPIDIPMIPEPYGHIVHAKDFDKARDTTETFFLSVHGRQSHLITAKPTLSGDLYFELGALKDYDYMIVQSTKYERQLNIRLQEPFLPFQFNDDFVFPHLALSENDKGFLLDLIAMGRVSSYYYKDTTHTFAPIVTGFLADNSYILGDFNRFENLATTLKEYVSVVMVRGQARRTLFKVINAPLNTVFEENPLILIDGMPVFDTDVLGAFDPVNIQKLDVVTREYYLNQDKYSGVVSFTSFANDFGGFDLPPNALYLTYLEIQKPRKLLSPHFNQRMGEANFPDFRHTLYWSSSYPLADGLTLYTSDSPGTYEIRASFLDAQGKWTLQKQAIVVKD